MIGGCLDLVWPLPICGENQLCQLKVRWPWAAVGKTVPRHLADDRVPKWAGGPPARPSFPASQF